MEGKAIPAGLVDRMLVALDVFPMGALFRVAAGYALVPGFQWLTGFGVADWRIVPWFIAVLIGIRVLCAVLRAPFSRDAKAVWVRRRDIAKRFDAYQWRKLLWLGSGMAIHAVASDDAGAWLIGLSATAIVAGVLGEIAWRSHGAPIIASEQRESRSVRRARGHAEEFGG